MKRARQRRPTWEAERRELLDGMRDLLRRNADPIDTFHGVLSGLRTVRQEKK